MSTSSSYVGRFFLSIFEYQPLCVVFERLVRFQYINTSLVFALCSAARRRLVVAMSRARFGLYAVGRAGLFSNCLELLPAFTKLTARPSKLKLLVGEQHPTPRGANEALPDVLARAGGALAEVEVQGVEHLGAVVTQILTAQMSMAGAAAAAAAAAAAGASSDAVTAAGGPSAAAFVGAEEEEDGSRGLDIEPSGADAVPGDEEGDGEQ